MSIVTRGGDGGETSLLYGGRVPKDDLHTEAYGALDEAISALGLARALETEDLARAGLIELLQRRLFTVGAELATSPAERHHLVENFDTVSAVWVEGLETAIAELEPRLRLPRSFIIPGATQVGAALDLARTFVRRAERWTVALQRAGQLADPVILRYLNRLSDYLFLLARDAEQGHSTVKGSSRH